MPLSRIYWRTLCQKPMAKSKTLNNMLHFYKESRCKSLKEFASTFNISYNTFTEQIRNDVEPTEDTIRGWCNKCSLDRDYFDQEREELNYEDLTYWHHTNAKYSIEDFLQACNMVREDIDLDRYELQKALKKLKEV